MKKPEIFFLGAPKCGTTAIGQYLSEHPSLHISSPKETNYFCGDFKTGERVYSDEEYLNKYFSELQSSTPDCIGVDASVLGLYATDTIQNILHFQKKARFIVMLRNPVEMAYSLYSMFTAMGWEDQPSLIAAWERQYDRKVGRVIPKEFPHDWDLRHLLYRDICSLGSQLARVYEQLDPERVCLIQLRDLKEDARKVYLRIISFIGVSDDGRTDFSPVNQGKRVSLNWLATAQRNRLVRRAYRLFKGLFEVESLNIKRLDVPPTEQELDFLTAQFKSENELLESVIKCNRA
jgi:hypothetical protein